VIFGEIFSPEILIPIVLVALLFGSSKIPELARSLGNAKREFEHGIHGDKTAAEDDG
jgi:sec-independent protein translocase protein TatA